MMVIFSKHNLLYLYFISCFICYSCKKNSTQKMNELLNLNTTISDLNYLSDDVKYLNNSTIFFGHRSVGSNIINGIQEIQNNYPQLKLNIKEISLTDLTLETPAFLHARVGINTKPDTKIDDFVKALDLYGNKIEIAFLKFCFVDINSKTDCEKLFNNYMSKITDIKVRYPKMEIIHFTVPLTTKQKGIKGKMKRIIHLDANIQRNKFNELIRKKFPENEIFDIARLESTYPNGKINQYGHNIPGLIPEYTNDGGHLNNQSRIYIAGKLLEMLLKTVE